MRNFLGVALLGSVSILTCTAALAQDAGAWIDPSASVMYGSASAYDWTGFYAGVNGGYGLGTVTTNVIGDPQKDQRGFQAGGQVGFNVNLGGLVLGAEADADWSNVNYSQPVPGGVTKSFSLDYLATARARVGFAYSQFLPYVTGGFAAGQGTSKYETLGGTFSQSNMHTGWTAGGGLEYAATDNITIKLEYLYTDLGTKTYLQGVGTPIDATFRFHTVRVGANFQF